MKKIAFLLFLTSLFASNSFAEDPLPRSVGQIMLGMSLNRFYALTNKKVGVCPGDCKPEEKCVVLTLKDLEKIGINGVDSVSIAFWKNKIYFLMYGFNERRKFIPSDFKRKYGKYVVEPQGTPGLVDAKWRTKNTAMMISYSSHDKEIISFAIKDLSRNTDGAAW